MPPITPPAIAAMGVVRDALDTGAAASLVGDELTAAASGVDIWMALVAVAGTEVAADDVAVGVVDDEVDKTELTAGKG